MNASWQRKRIRFNHDWLKNEYLLALGCWQRMLEDSVRDPQSEGRFLTSVLPTWTKRREEAYALVLSFEAEMSPAVLMNRLPLKDMQPETRAWLEPLIRDLWRSRSVVSHHLQETVAAITAVDDGYDQLRAAIGDRTSIEELRSLYDEFARFEGLCQELSRRLGLLPARIIVT